MTKKELRKIYRTKRQELSEQEALVKSQQIIDLLLKNFDLKPYQNLHTFFPILSRKEINTFYLIERIRKEFPHLSILTSTTDFETHEMKTFEIQADTKLIKNQFGIPEPQHAQPFPNAKIELIIMPLLCMDQKGNRVGYGMGHYDRFLVTCSDQLIKIGLSYFSPVEYFEGVESTDIPLDYAVAADRFITF